jgi:hypothetical protein
VLPRALGALSVAAMSGSSSGQIRPYVAEQCNPGKSEPLKISSLISLRFRIYRFVTFVGWVVSRQIRQGTLVRTMSLE